PTALPPFFDDRWDAMSTSMTDRLWTAAELAMRLHIGPARLYELVRQGLVPAVRLGRQVRFDPAAVEAWIARGGRALPGGWRREVCPEATSSERANARSAAPSPARPARTATATPEGSSRGDR